MDLLVIKRVEGCCQLGFFLLKVGCDPRTLKAAFARTPTPKLRLKAAKQERGIMLGWWRGSGLGLLTTSNPHEVLNEVT